MKDLGFQNLDKLVRMVKQENRRQITIWGIQDRSPFEWMTWITEELGELARALADNEYDRPDGFESFVVNEAIQVATLVLKIAEMYDEKEFLTGRHSREVT